MQIKIFSIPVLGSEQMNDEMNAFLRSKKVLQVENQLVSDPHGAFWCFCIRYIEDNVPAPKPRPDYKQILDEESFQRFARMKEIRKRIAKDEGLPPYAVFSDEELAGLAKIEVLTPGLMKTVKGVGDRKAERGLPFLGYLIYPFNIRLSQRSKRRFIKKMVILDEYHQSEFWPEADCQRRVLPLVAFTAYADAAAFRRNVLLKISGQSP